MTYTSQLQLSLLLEIIDLHSEIVSATRTTIDKAIRIGELLTQQKAKLKHGQWLPWIESNLPFSQQTASNYVRLFEKRDKLPTVGNLELTDAYRLLAEPAPPEVGLFSERPTTTNGHPTEAGIVGECLDCGRSVDTSRLQPDSFGCKECSPETSRRILPVDIFTGDDENYTPPEFLELVRKVLGKIDLDPASNAFAQKTVNAAKFFDEKQDGLAWDWSGRIFLNPPYSNPLIRQFIRRLISECRSGNVSQAILLTNDNTDTEWFHEAASACKLFCLRKGRINFYKADGITRMSPTNGHTTFFFGKDGSKFQKVFSSIGLICKTL